MGWAGRLRLPAFAPSSRREAVLSVCVSVYCSFETVGKWWPRSGLQGDGDSHPQSLPPPDYQRKAMRPHPRHPVSSPEGRDGQQLLWFPGFLGVVLKQPTHWDLG